jgi:hypothetical protein
MPQYVCGWLIYAITEAAPPVSARRRQHLMCSKLDLPAGSSGRRACKYFIRELLGPSLFASVTGRGRKLRRRRKHTTLVLSAGCNLSPPPPQRAEFSILLLSTAFYPAQRRIHTCIQLTQRVAALLVNNFAAAGGIQHDSLKAFTDRVAVELHVKNQHVISSKPLE